MRTKKIMLIVGGGLVGLAFLTVVFVTVIVVFGLYTIKNSESAEKAKDYLRRNEKLKQDIGEVQGFGSIVTASLNERDGNNEVTFKLKVIGAQKTVNATVDLVLAPGNTWRVTSASYVNSLGEKVPLLDPYDTKVPVASVTA